MLLLSQPFQEEKEMVLVHYIKDKNNGVLVLKKMPAWRPYYMYISSQTYTAVFYHYPGTQNIPFINRRESFYNRPSYIPLFTSVPSAENNDKPIILYKKKKKFSALKRLI